MADGSHLENIRVCTECTPCVQTVRVSVSMYNQLYSIQRLQLKLDVSPNVLLKQRTATFHELLLHRARVVCHCQHTHQLSNHTSNTSPTCVSHPALYVGRNTILQPVDTSVLTVSSELKTTSNVVFSWHRQVASLCSLASALDGSDK